MLSLSPGVLICLSSMCLWLLGCMSSFQTSWKKARKIPSPYNVTRECVVAVVVLFYQSPWYPSPGWKSRKVRQYAMAIRKRQWKTTCLEWTMRECFWLQCPFLIKIEYSRDVFFWRNFFLIVYLFLNWLYEGLILYNNNSIWNRIQV